MPQALPPKGTEAWAESRLVYDGKVVRLRVGEVTLDNGARAYREVVEHPGGVCVIPYTKRDSVLLIRQFRIALDDFVLEAPAGKIEPGDTPEHRGRAEVEEEVGCRPGRMIDIGRIYPTVGFCSEIIHLYIALDIEHVEQQLEHDERLEIVEMPLDEVRDGLRQNRFMDAKTIVGLQRLLVYLED